MDDKYQISKNKKPETKSEILQRQIEELVKRRGNETSLAAKQAINAESTKLFVQYERQRYRSAHPQSLPIHTRYLRSSEVLRRDAFDFEHEIGTVRFRGSLIAGREVFGGEVFGVVEGLVAGVNKFALLWTRLFRLEGYLDSCIKSSG